ncbi:DUF2231 domain-containing protein [Aureimonas altamirensis]|uniref:DUF2231 domain-containing protein n=1 Tax=Aureimonas altamirensis TaxID=370622 RepID=UPI00068D0FDD|nr:DUF2231 domain-containing protein [Aureimonas altamirensis]
MTHTIDGGRSFSRAIHGILLSFPVALFATALAADIAYLNTAEIQWTNFASWAIAGALVFGGLVAAWALVDWLFKLRRADSGSRLLYFAVVALMWVLGLVNAFHHARDAWSSVGTVGVGLSAITTILALVAGWMFFSRTTRLEAAR